MNRETYYAKLAMEISKRCRNMKIPTNIEYEIVRGIYKIYWDEVANESR